MDDDDFFGPVQVRIFARGSQGEKAAKAVFQACTEAGLSALTFGDEATSSPALLVVARNERAVSVARQALMPPPVWATICTQPIDEGPWLASNVSIILSLIGSVVSQ